MMEGLFDDNDVADEDPFCEEGPDIAVEVADQLFQVSNLYQPSVLPVMEVQPGATQRACPADVAHDSPEGLLFKAAYQGHLHCFLPPVKRRRMADKRPPSLEQALLWLQQDPGRGSMYVGTVPRWKRRMKAYYHYLQWLGQEIGCSGRQCRDKVSRAEFGEHPEEVVNAWFLLATIADDVYVPAQRGSSCPFRVRPELKHKLPAGADRPALASAEKPVKGMGLFATFFTGFGLDDPLVLDLATHAHSRQEIADKLKQSPGHEQHFREFELWVQAAARRLGMQTHACSMEVGTSDSADHPCAVHLHFYMTSSSPVDGGWLRVPQAVMVEPTSLKFSESGSSWVNVVPWRKSAPRAISMAQSGMYYILCRKIGSVFSSGTHVPFQDLTSHGMREHGEVTHKCCVDG